VELYLHAPVCLNEVQKLSPVPSSIFRIGASVTHEISLITRTANLKFYA
jgi:hypothetical protein